MGAWAKSRRLRDDEEMAKKDDDLKRPRRKPKPSETWSAPTPYPARRTVTKRFLVYAAIIFGTIFLLGRMFGGGNDFPDREPPQHIPHAKGGQSRYAPGHRFGSSPTDETNGKGSYKAPAPKTDPKPKPPPPREKQKQPSKQKEKQPTREKATGEYYSGPIKLPKLANTLRSVVNTGGSMSVNRNVLIAASSAQALSNMLPFACQMAAEKESYVHVAVMGQSDLSKEELFELNGVDETCEVLMHDARVDHAEESNERRLTLGTLSAFRYITRYVHPQAVIIDGSAAEDTFFINAARDQFLATNTPVIELPNNSHNSLGWVAKLDSTALAAWHDAQFDILIQAPYHGSGNIIRLLRSIANADLSGHAVPHITVELPPTQDKALEEFLAGYQWPRPSIYGQQPQAITLRHRIANRKLTEEESSIRFVESFWPSRPSHKHVLVLSPNTEITPQFFHYVKYELLQRKYTRVGHSQDIDTSLLGISFAQPTTYDHSDATFSLPKASGSKDGAAESGFLWQLPGSDAMLVFGDKWIELHGFISGVQASLQALGKAPDQLSKKLNARLPAWMEHLLELSRLRGYTTLYPSHATTSSIISVHDDLVGAPEEFSDRPANGKSTSQKQGATASTTDSTIDVMKTLSKDGSLPNLLRLSVLSWDGQSSTKEELKQEAVKLLKEFRTEVGQCHDVDATLIKKDRFARDMFCNK